MTRNFFRFHFPARQMNIFYMVSNSPFPPTHSGTCVPIKSQPQFTFLFHRNSLNELWNATALRWRRPSFRFEKINFAEVTYKRWKEDTKGAICKEMRMIMSAEMALKCDKWTHLDKVSPCPLRRPQCSIPIIGFRFFLFVCLAGLQGRQQNSS